MALVVFLQEDEDFSSVYRNLKIFLETAPPPPVSVFVSPLSLCLFQYHTRITLSDAMELYTNQFTFT